MKKNSLTDQEIQKRRQQAHEAEILASLDNDAEYPKEYIEAREKYINGEITYEELVKIAFKI